MAEIKKNQGNEPLWFANHLMGLKHQPSKSTIPLNNSRKSRRIGSQNDSDLRVHSFLEQVERNHPDFFKSINNPQLILPAINLETEIDPFESRRKEFAGLIQVSMDGVSVWLDEDLEKQGVIIDSLRKIEATHSKLIKDIRQESNEKNRSPLSKVIDSLAGDAIILHVPQNVVVEGLILCEIAVPKEGITAVRIVTHIAPGAEAGIVVSMQGQRGQTNHAVLAVAHEVFIGENARFDFFCNQQAGDDVLVLFDHKIQQKNSSSTEVFSLDLGACGMEHGLSLDLAGEGSESVISGLYRPARGSRYFFRTDQLHNASHSMSDLEYKGVLGEETFTSWHGNILVKEKTVGTNGYQANHNLIIGESAKVESVPGLEILTDDVRCSHGVTIGNIDKTHMFYLQSRGINEEDAEALIIDGFLESALKRVKSDRLIKYISQSFNKRL